MAMLRILALSALAAAAVSALPAARPATAAPEARTMSFNGSQFIGEREVARRIASLVQQRNGGQPVEISFHGYGNEIEVPAATPAVLQVESFAFDSRSGRFYADLTTPGRKETVKFSGRAQPVETVPVLRNRIAPGETISRGDIELVQVQAGRYGAGYIDQVEDLIGQTPRRPLSVGAPIRSADVGLPNTISKNAMVTMVAQVPGMTITTSGRAMEAGRIGDVIQVMNLQSKKMIQATITGPSQVQVITAPRVIAAK